MITFSHYGLLVSLILGPHVFVQADCECGFFTNSGHVWRESIETVFDTHFNLKKNHYWKVQTWNASTTVNDGIYPIANKESNVYISDDLLNIRVEGYNDGLQEKVIGIGEIDTYRSDIKYGSFRTLARSTTVKGTCAGFFTYNDDNNEADIEILSSDTRNSVHYSHQPDHNPSTGTIIPRSSIHYIAPLNMTDFNQHRMDWFPDHSEFFFNGLLTSTLDVNIPTKPSTFIINHWSNGGQWTRGHPKEDAILKIVYVALYFNSTSVTETEFVKTCEIAKENNVTRPICLVDSFEYTFFKMGKNSSPTPTKFLL